MESDKLLEKTKDEAIVETGSNDSTQLSQEQIIVNENEKDVILQVPVPSDVPVESVSDREIVQEQVDWSKELSTPQQNPLDVCSPSDPNSLHGRGIWLASERSKKLVKANQHCATLLSDVSQIVETFSQSINSKTFHHFASSPTAQYKLEVVRQSWTQLCQHSLQMSQDWKSRVSKPWKTSLQAIGEGIPHIFQRYQEQRKKSQSRRQRALQSRSQYLAVAKQAEDVIAEITNYNKTEQQQQDSPVPSTNDDDGSSSLSALNASVSQPWEQKLKRRLGRNPLGKSEKLMKLLHQVQALEQVYRLNVQDENRVAQQTQCMEQMALEAIQDLEDQRAVFFVDSITLVMKSQQDALEGMEFTKSAETSNVPPPENNSVTSTNGPSFKSPFPKGKNPGNEFFKNLLKQTTTVEGQGLGLMEAETLGLGEAVGLIRDDVKNQIRSCERRVQVVKALAMLLEEMASACINLANALTTRVGQEGYFSRKNTQQDVLSTVLQENEGKNTLEYWTAVILGWEALSCSAQTLALTLKDLRRKNLDSVLQEAEKDMKSANDADDVRWKYLCETARTETRAEVKYQQSSSQSEKARVRAASVENSVGSRERSNAGPKIAAGMSKAIGNMISILPNGGEHAMKMMTPDARRAVAQSTLSETSQRESKDKQALEAATTAKEQALESYKSSAYKTIDVFSKEDEEGWKTVDATLDEFVNAFQEFQSTILGSLERKAVVPGVRERNEDNMGWVKTAKEKFAQQIKESKGASKHGIMLSVRLSPSQKVYKLLSLVSSDDENMDVSKVLEEEEQSELDVANGIISSDEARDESFISELSEAEFASLVEPTNQSDGVDLTASTQELMIIAEDLKEKSEGSLEAARPINNDDGTDSLGRFGLAMYLPEKDNTGNAVEIVDAFPCTYWPKERDGFMSRLIQGRMFVTKSTLFVVGWDGKKLFFDWPVVSDLTKELSLDGVKDDAVRVTCADKTYFFGKIDQRKDKFELLEKIRAEALLPKANDKSLNNNKANSSKVVGPDKTIEKMEVLMSRSLKNVSVQKFYEIAWSEGQDTDAEPLYGPWLTEMGSRNVQVSSWKMESVENNWCKESYSRSRTIQFEFERKTHLYIGPPIAKVLQKQYCRVDGNDRCILQMTVEMEGIPYADCFAVEVRWIATRIGQSDLQIQVGVFVDFKKKTMFAKQIKAGTFTETKPIHAKLFDRIKASLPHDDLGDEEEAQDDAEDEKADTSSDELAFMGITLSDVNKHAQQIFESVMEGDQMTIAFVVLGAAVILRILIRLLSFMFLGSRGTPQSTTDELLLSLDSKVEVLQQEVRQLRETIDALQTLLVKETR